MEIEVRTLKYIAAFFIILLIIYSQTRTKVIVIEKRERGNLLSKKDSKKSSKDSKKNRKVYNRTFSEIKQKNKMSIISRKFIKIENFSGAGDFETAIDELTKIVNSTTQTDPYIKAKSMYELARMYMVMKNFEAANKFFKEFIKTFPGHKEVENAKRALTYMKKYENYKKEFVGFEKEIENNNR